MFDLKGFEIVAPAHWKAEFANVVWKSVLRGEVPLEAAPGFLTAVDAGKWTRRNPASQTGSAILPAETR